MNDLSSLFSIELMQNLPAPLDARSLRQRAVHHPVNPLHLLLRFRLLGLYPDGRELLHQRHPAAGPSRC